VAYALSGLTLDDLEGRYALLRLNGDETGSRLLLIIDRKSHIGFQMKWKSSTSDDLEGHWQPVRSAILATAGFLLFILLFSSAYGHLIRSYRTLLASADQ